MALDIEAFFGLPTQADTLMPTVFPRRKPSPAAMAGFTPIAMSPSTASSPQGRSIPVYANPAASPASMAMPSMLPKPKPAMPTVTPYSQMGAPDFVTAMPKPNLVTPQQTQMASQGGLLGNLLADDINSAKGRGILSAAASLMQAGAPVKGQPAPSLGSAIGGAINAGFSTYDDAIAREKAIASQAITDRYKEAQAAQMEAAAKRPIMTDYANGAFTRITDPVTGETKIVENTNVTDFLKEQAIRRQTKNINLSDTQIEKQTEDLDNIRATQDLMDEATEFADMISKGEIDFGFSADMKNAAAARLPQSMVSDEARTLASNRQRFDKYLQNLRNQIMTQAKGAQTEGDAQRALEMLATAEDKNDPDLMQAAVEYLIETQKKIIRRTKAKVQDRRAEKGLSRYEFKDADSVGYKVVESDNDDT